MFQRVKDMSTTTKIAWGIGIFLFLWVIVAVVTPPAPSAKATPATTHTTANVSATPTHKPLPTDEPRKPITVLHYDGTSNHTTDNFNISSPTWTISWKCQASNYDGVLYVNLYDASGTLVSAPVSTECKGQQSSDTTTIHSPGKFYLEILSANATYSVTVIDPNTPLG